MNLKRTKLIRMLSDIYTPYYLRLCDELGEEWQPYSGFRSFEEQDILYAKGRTVLGPKITDARGGESPHNYGCASDWCLWEGSKPIWPAAKNPAWDPYIAAVKKVGLRPGATFGDYPHNELMISCRYEDIYEEYKNHEMQGAISKIRESLAT